MAANNPNDPDYDPTKATQPSQPSFTDNTDGGTGTSVASRVSGLLTPDNPLMQQARTGALQQSNSRGMLNTSMATQAGEAAVVNAAVPIATADATNAQQTKLNSATIQSQKDLQAVDLKAQNDRLAQTLGSNEKLQEAQLAAQKEQLGMQLTQQEKLAVNDLNAAQQRLNDQLKSNETISTNSLNEQSQNSIAQAVTANNGYYNSNFQAIANNKDIPADVRNAYLTHISDLSNSQMKLLSDVYGVNLNWSTPAVPANTNANAATPVIPTNVGMNG